MTKSTLSAIVLSVAVIGTAGSAQAQQAKLYFEGDMVRAAQAGAPGPFCVLNNQFKRNEKVAWRIRVTDATGKNIDDKGIHRLFVVLPDGKRFQATYKEHPNRPPVTDHFWSVSWLVPDDYPTGTFAYKVVATDLQGKEHTWEPFKISTSQLTVLADKIELKR
jgi:hypothetical protein